MSEPIRNPKLSAVSTTPSDKSLTTLMRELANDVTSLFTKEVALAKSEISHSMSSAKTGILGVMSGGAVLQSGFLFLLLAAVLGLGQVMELWLASLIVGGVVTLIGFAMMQAGKKKLEASSLKPSHTLNSLHKDQSAIKGATR
ncbi:MAG: phage holin family protein [Cellvibrio sp.]|jgi:xanthine/uracil permease